MEQILTTFSVSEIIMFFIAAAAAIKGTITFIDWVNSTMIHIVHEKERPANIELQLQQIVEANHEHIKALEEKDAELQQQFNSLTEKIDLLLNSDKDDIKAWITQQYHLFKEQGYIDDYSLDCIEHRYEHYKREKGNSFVKVLVEELRQLPKK